MSPRLDGVEYFESILDTVGNTPLVRLRHVAERCPCPVLAKVEFFNPGGSVKDRIGLAMVEDAERAGRLAPGGTIVECTSGNTGLGLAMVAAVKGYHSVFCMPDKVSSEKVYLLKAFGAEVHLSPTAVTPDHPDSYYSVAKRIAAERSGAVLMNQYHNPANPAAHYATTGPELWKQTGGRITHFVAGMGTGGTISGIARYLKERNPKVQVIGADPVGSILKHYKDTGEIGEAHTYKIEGVGEDFIPTALDMSLVDRVISCNDRDGLNMTRRLAREEAIFVGGSSGMAVWVAFEAAMDCKPDDLVVVLLPDTGERYLTKVHNDEWMRDNHLLDPSAASAYEVATGKSRKLPALLHVQSGEPLKHALALIEQHDVSQLPVMRGDEVLGTLEENEALKAALSDPRAVEIPVDRWMGKPLPVVDADEDAEQVTRLLARDPAVLVRRDGRVVGILTRFDMLQFIAGE
ncbi:MAG: cystathionine beta-synthase [Candidatus Eisenbacteria bacterium]